ncbi:MAG: preprotein translocase subunit YajC [Oscillospiraceae bacterium]|nr:preprotein translocase subunit YajC [Oscillospiraceae bacterium]MBQ8780650.1 preprotein translocase subunit YajC [Oscillospiraceae bacterium]
MNTALLNVMLTATADAAAAGDSAQQASTMGSIIYMIFSFGLLFVVFYFFMIRPQKKKEKEAKQLRDNLQIGDEVTTIGGITGIVVRKTEDTVVIETGGDRSKIRVKLWAISENATIHDMPEEEISKK